MTKSFILSNKALNKKFPQRGCFYVHTKRIKQRLLSTNNVFPLKRTNSAFQGHVYS